MLKYEKYTNWIMFINLGRKNAKGNCAKGIYVGYLCETLRLIKDLQ